MNSPIIEIITLKDNLSEAQKRKMLKAATMAFNEGDKHVGIIFRNNQIKVFYPTAESATVNEVAMIILLSNKEFRDNLAKWITVFDDNSEAEQNWDDADDYRPTGDAALLMKWAQAKYDSYFEKCDDLVYMGTGESVTEQDREPQWDLKVTTKLHFKEALDEDSKSLMANICRRAFNYETICKVPVKREGDTILIVFDTKESKTNMFKGLHILLNQESFLECIREWESITNEGNEDSNSSDLLEIYRHSVMVDDEMDAIAKSLSKNVYPYIREEAMKEEAALKIMLQKWEDTFRGKEEK